MTYSIVVSCFDVGTNIDSQLDALAQQVDRSATEIIVVDDFSTDDTSAVASRWIDAHPDVAITLLRAPRRGGPNRSRNVGALVAHGRWILTLDGDDVVRPGWFDAMSTMLGAVSPATIVSGRVVGPNGSPDAPFDYRGFPTTFGGNMAVARETLLSIGGFDEVVFRGGTETEFVLRAQRLGASVTVCDEALIDYRALGDDSPVRARTRLHVQRARGQAYLEHRLRLTGMTRPGSAELASLWSFAKLALLAVVRPRVASRSTYLILASSSLVRLVWIEWFRLRRPQPRLADPSSPGEYAVVRTGHPVTPRSRT